MVKRVALHNHSGGTTDFNDVGYGKPPKAHQFPKGHSGNPRGRPKGSRNLVTDLNQALNETVDVVENGRRRKITKREAICRQLTNRSAGGDLAALRLLIPLLSQIEVVASNEGFEFDPAQDRALAQALFSRLGHLDDEPPKGGGS